MLTAKQLETATLKLCQTHRDNSSISAAAITLHTVMAHLFYTAMLRHRTATPSRICPEGSTTSFHEFLRSFLVTCAMPESCTFFPGKTSSQSGPCTQSLCQSADVSSCLQILILPCHQRQTRVVGRCSSAACCSKILTIS